MHCWQARFSDLSFDQFTSEYNTWMKNGLSAYRKEHPQHGVVATVVDVLIGNAR
jgi:hypothetical protein